MVPSAVSDFSPSSGSYPISVQNLAKMVSEIAHQNNHNNKTEYYHSEALWISAYRDQIQSRCDKID